MSKHKSTDMQKTISVSLCMDHTQIHMCVCMRTQHLNAPQTCPKTSYAHKFSNNISGSFEADLKTRHSFCEVRVQIKTLKLYQIIHKEIPSKV